MSAWAANTRFDQLKGASISRANATEYGGSAQLEYFEGEQGKNGFDQVTLNVRYQGPTRSLQIQTGGILGLDLAYTRYLTDRLSLVSSINRLIGNRVVITQRSAPSFQEVQSSEIYGPFLRFSLIYNLGK